LGAFETEFHWIQFFNFNFHPCGISAAIMGLFDLAKKAVRRVLERRSLRRIPTASIVPPVVEPPVVEPPVVASPWNRPAVHPQQSPVGPATQSPTGTAPQSPQQSQPVRTQVSPAEQRDIKQVQEAYNEIELLGRDRSYDDPEAVNRLMEKMRQVSSSNVWGYYFELEGSQHAGLLYVTFLADAPPGGKRPQSPGSTYVYFDVPTKKYHEFARASDSSAGKAVWDYLRVRGTVWQHQHRYKFVQNQGEYVPRKVTSTGFRTRHQSNPFASRIPNETWSALSRLEKSKNPAVADYGRKMRRDLLQKAGHRRSTLAPRTFLKKSIEPQTLLNQGKPNRGGPNRGRP
jgi:hypothetical protein